MSNNVLCFYLRLTLVFLINNTSTGFTPKPNLYKGATYTLVQGIFMGFIKFLNLPYIILI